MSIFISKLFPLTHDGCRVSRISRESFIGLDLPYDSPLVPGALPEKDLNGGIIAHCFVLKFLLSFWLPFFLGLPTRLFVGVLYQNCVLTPILSPFPLCLCLYYSESSNPSNQSEFIRASPGNQIPHILPRRLQTTLPQRQNPPLIQSPFLPPGRILHL